jgi:probable HAF family extracellular repeat protein
MTDLGTLNNVVGDSEALWINDSGQIVGWSSLPGDDPEMQDYHAVLWENGEIHDLGTLGGSSSEAYAINEAGQIVGGSFISGDTEWHAFLWQNGVMQDLGTLGGIDSDAFSINDSGQIAGASYTSGDVEFHATLWKGLAKNDFNGDGTSDVLVRHTNGSWYIYLMNTDGVTVKQGSYMPFTSDLDWQLADVSDFNGDGTPDVLVRHSSGSWYIYLMNTDGTTVKQGAYMPFTSDLDWQLADVVDFDGNGTPDVLVRHSSGSWYQYLMNADGVTVKQGAYMPFTSDLAWQLVIY